MERASQTLTAIRQVSELKSLWAEAGSDDYAEWDKALGELLTRVQGKQTAKATDKPSAHSGSKTKRTPKVKIGDIVEVPTALGLAYAQYTHQHPSHGALLRVIEGFFPERPQDLDKLAAAQTKFFTFLPLQGTVRVGLATYIGWAPVPAHSSKFPLFRSGMFDPSTKCVGDNWWLWDGDREWRVGKLKPEQYHLPLRQIVNVAMLVHRLEIGWLPEHVH